MPALLALAGCADIEATLARFDPDAPGPLGRAIDRPPPPVQVVQTGASGPLLGPAAAPVPEPAIDRIVAEPLRTWLTLEERRRLADASEHAAVVPTGTAIPWQALNGANVRTASGTAMPVGNVYRSRRGEICRDVRQTVVRTDAPPPQIVALCRDSQADTVPLWVIGAVD